LGVKPKMNAMRGRCWTASIEIKEGVLRGGQKNTATGSGVAVEVMFQSMCGNVAPALAWHNPGLERERYGV
jgi:hypothetical protein